METTCESAYEFLFEPWILIHLPFKGLLLNQWLLAAHAETLEFEKNVSEFFHSSIPSSLQKPVEQLASLLIILHKYIPIVSDEMKNKDKRPLFSSFEKLLPPLEFVCSAEGKNMVKALRRKLLDSETNEELVNVQRGYCDKKYLYCLKTWLGNETYDGDGEINVSEKEFLDIVWKLAPQTPITEQLKSRLVDKFRCCQLLRLNVFHYKYRTTGFCYFSVAPFLRQRFLFTNTCVDFKCQKLM